MDAAPSSIAVEVLMVSPGTFPNPSLLIDRPSVVISENGIQFMATFSLGVSFESTHSSKQKSISHPFKLRKDSLTICLAYGMQDAENGMARCWSPSRCVRFAYLSLFASEFGSCEVRVASFHTRYWCRAEHRTGSDSYRCIRMTQCSPMYNVSFDIERFESIYTMQHLYDVKVYGRDKAL